MKQIITNIKKAGVFVVMAAGLAACNKEKEQVKAVSIEIMGYNVGNTQLQVSVDTVVFRNDIVEPDRLINFSRIYTYPSGKGQSLLSIKDLITGAEMYRQQINLNEGLELFYPFVLINGSQLAINPPVAEPSTNKLGFYIHYPASNDLIDIYLKNPAGQMVRVAANVQPSNWVYVDYIPEDGFKDPNPSYTLHFMKAGTTDSWAFQDSEWMSMAYESTLYFPKSEQKGQVRSYFVTPGFNQLDIVRLSKRP